MPDIVTRTEAVYAFHEEGDYTPPWYKDLAFNVSRDRCVLDLALIPVPQAAERRRAQSL